MTCVLRPRIALACGGLALATMLSACGASTGSTPTRTGTAVTVIYAGSLSKLMEDRVGPAFARSSGYSYRGFGGGSGEDAIQIKNGIRRADVFISASPRADADLEGAANGNWVSWYSTFATTPLVLAYDPRTSFGEELAHGEPWYRVITQKGITVGRTDPKLDPKGKLTVDAIETAARDLHDVPLGHVFARFPVFPETDLLGRLQAGQLDAGFFYDVEARVAGIPSVTLAPVSQAASFTVTILNRASQRAGAEAFLHYLLAPDSRVMMAGAGLTGVRPRLSGASAAVPAGLRGSVGVPSA